MSTIHLSNYGISITPGKMDAVNREIQQKIQIGEPFELDFDGVEGLDTRAAYALLEPLRKHYGKDYRKYVSFSNVAPMVNNALIFSGTTSPNTVISNPRTPKHSFTSAFSRIFATILLLLTLGVGQMRGDSGFYRTGQWKIGYNDGSDHWIDYKDDGATVDLGIKTQLSLIGCNVYTWGYVKTNLDWWKSFSSSLDAVDNGTGNFWSIYADWDGNHEWYMDCNDYDMIAGASNNPGNNTLYMRWSLRNYNTKTDQAKITFTIPGFTTTSTSQTFNNTTVSSNSSTTISFGTHYGTALETSNCSITGTNNSDFSVTDIDESGVTVKFMPSAIGSRSATLTITDAHSKTCTITLSGTGTAPAETTHSVTVSYVCTSPSATVSTATTPTIGEVTYSEQTAPVVAGYTFSNWTYGDGISVKSGDTNTSNPIHVKTLSSGTYTLTANYTEDLTSTWKIVGQSPSDKANSPFSSWTYASSTNTMAKATGHSTESVVYATISVPAASVTGDYYEFKVTGDGSTLYGYGESGEDNITFDVTKTNQTVYSNSNNDHALRFKPNVAGDYTFKVDYSGNDPKVSVTFPISYTVNFGVSPTGAADAPTNDKSVSNGGLVLSGTSVTFTHGDAKTGYTWSHWDVGGENVSTGSTYTTSITAATTVTAVYTEDTHTVMVATTTGGSTNVESVSGVGVATASSTITATPANLAWRFKEWTIPDGVTIASGSTTNASITIKATADSKNITANFEPRYGLVGSRLDGETADGMPLWTNSAAADFVVTSFTDKDNMNLTCTRTLSANKDYKFQVYDRESNACRGGDSDATMTLGDNWKLTGSGVISFDTKGAGDYTFQITNIDDSNYQPSIQINAPTSYTVTFDKGTGGSDVTASGSVSGSITSGQYVAEGEDITFTQTPEPGYTFKGWYDAASGGSAISSMASDNVLDNIVANATVYAQYTENMTTVNLSATNGKIQYWDGDSWEDAASSVNVGVATNCSIKAVPATGYYFSGWVNTEGSDYEITGSFNVENNNNTTLKGKGVGEMTGQTLTANFVELDKIYFRNIFDDGEGNVTRWENVYVHFDISWADYSGKQAVKTSADNSTKGLHVAMTQIGSSDVYWAYVPRYITANSKARVAFADHEDTYDDSYLWEGMASGRGDYSPLLNMFVPYHSANETGVNGVDYYSNGYWMKYDTKASQGAGYYLKVFNDRNDYTQKGEFIANTDDATIIQYQVRVDNTGADKTRFMITSAGGLNYIADETITSVSGAVEVSENLSTLTDNDVYFQLTATSEGYYTFIIDQTGDKMKLTVDYPVSPGDYRLKHTYTGRNKANTADSTYTTYSDVIKASTAGTAKTYSMYLNTGGTETLVLQECERINSDTKLPEWSEGDGANLSGILSKLGTDDNGVYQFDITVNTTSHQVNTVTNIGKYTGNYYIKTDCATGGWVNYTQNVMEKNNATFSSEDASTYDYFYCKWVDSGNGGDGGGTNVKCVIANDYCNAVSDTLEGDDILGGAQILPKAANVRFSYNSTTNTLKRTYINGATGWESSFLSLTDAKSGNDGTGTAMITHYGDAALTNDTLSFVDMNNWIYQRDLKAKPGSRIRLTANYKYNNTDHEQYLIGQTGDLSSSTTVQIIGGETDEFIPMRAIYDFKTNNLIVGYLASNENVTVTRALNADVLIVREDQGDAAQITFGNNVHFTEVDTVYGILELKKSSILDENKSIYERALYWISFPFDVKLGDVFGFGEYGKHWMIQYYDGAARAQNGFWAEVETYWKWVMPNERANFTLEANKGYLLGLDLDEMTSASTVWGNNVQSVSLYFPSSGEVGSITWPLTSSKNVVVQTHECTIERDDRWYKDANWNVIGVPSYANWTKTVVAETAVSQSETLVPHNVPFLYRHNTTNNTLEAVASSSVTFKSMQAYVVQYAGTIDWTTNAGPFAAPKRTPEQNGERNLTLNLAGDNEAADHTYIRFTDEEGITEGLDMNKDLTKEFKPQANIYSLVPGRVSQVQLAANLLPADYTTTTVEVGVRVAQDGYYTFSMPSTDGLTVVLYDRLTETRTNLLIGTYRAELSAGTTNGRFVLEIGNAQAPTAIQSVGNDANGEQVIKFVQDGQLYIIKNGRVFNAEGKAIE